MTVAFESGRLARSLGIVIVFTIIGPFVATAVFGLFILLVGLPLLRIMLDLVDLQALSTWLSVAVFLLVFFALAAAVIPSILAGIGFAVAAIYCRLS